MKQQGLLTRRSFIKSATATAAAVGFGGTIFDFIFSGLSPIGATASIDRKVFNNACPRNCYDTCSIISTVEDGVLKKVEGNPTSTYTRGRLCAKGYSYTRSVYSPDRIKYPMRQMGRGSGNWQRISWDEAYSEIAKTILRIKKEYGSTLPICLNKYSGNFDIMHYGIEGMLTSIGNTTRATGTPCWPAGIDAQTFDFGTIYSNDPEDIVNSKYMIIWGANPAWCSLHSMFFIKEAQNRGCKIVVIDPLLSQTASKADLYLQIKASTDGALALGMARYILDNSLYDGDWLAKNSKGAEEFFSYLKNDITVEWAAQKTGIPQYVIERLAREYATTKPANIWIGYGMQRHTNGGQNVRAIDALAAMTGNIGKSGGGAQYAHLQTWGFDYHAMSQKKPENSGGNGDRSININNFGAEVLSAKEPPIKMLWIACRGPMTQDPETSVVKKAFEAMDLVVTADMYMNPTVEMSDIVLPVTTTFETPGVNVSYWHYWLSLNEQAIKPMYESKNDVTIAMELSAKLNELEKGSCTFPTSGDLQEWVGKEFNDGIYKQFGINNWSELKKGPVKAKSGLIAWQDSKFKTPSGKYEFWSEEAKKLGHFPLPVYVEEMQPTDKYPLRCISSHWKLNIHSQFQNLDWMASINNEPCLELHPSVATAYGIKDKDSVKMYNEIGYIILPAKVTETVSPDVVAVYEAWYKGKKFNVNYTVKAIPADMGKKATGSPGIAFHDNFVAIQKV
ncbi:molybdopterin-dependent oxidoreductase [Sporomusa malonica]|uniref:Tat (Twin-arginine translocation) pathway signal sequence n=1 Tax=Sporomusa malonica TaxID=112901 RepID=A0A1W1Z9G0_9FIRM|nr:molybdopterin-dependent oxidoreductase [Sporomusa malonica]SMC44831.1 Tat (twin-arginine translocation) pathway signal sequence [Sporomusa malonica]